ncbi:hypothetical protein [Streptomyces sp. TS71-3]|uniref:hypothetical protein n=1 Tax=Streptomyces sp. TS71-3 TaxID=2733862 RepID=UPI001B041600|nr:hypothetical protein [Streptomyces sp. TS71-3]GHJ41132.1 hypothetical protein Sm713_67410 [Streptomyces sp. TS71-3]
MDSSTTRLISRSLLVATLLTGGLLAVPSHARAADDPRMETNQPALIVAAAGEAVDSRIAVHHGHTGGDQVCLVNADNGLGFPGKTVRVAKGGRSAELTTARDGCASVPGVNWRGATVAFAGDGAVHESATRLVP